MSEQIEFLLSDEYVQFSQKIAEIHAWKKALKEEFKKKYDEYQKSLTSMDDEAKLALQNFEQWKGQEKLAAERRQAAKAHKEKQHDNTN